MLMNFRIGARILLIVSMAIVGMLAMAVLGLINLKHNLFIDRQLKIEQLVRAAHTVVADFHHRAQQGEFSDQEARQRALAVVSAMRYTPDDYMFILDGAGTMLAHRNPEVVGRSFWDHVDQHGTYFARELIREARHGGGFVYYDWPRAGGGQPLPKASYASYFEPWGWVVATGIYIDDVDAVFLTEAGRNALIALSALGLFSCASSAAIADEVLVVRPPLVPHVLRVKPGSYMKQYPFGVLREDYTPYGMAGVRARDYFDVIGTTRASRRHVVRAAY